MPSLRLSNPFRRNADRPSLKDRAAALKTAAARVMKRKPAAPMSVADRLREMRDYHEGFVPYPTAEPTTLLAIERAIPLEAKRLLDMARAEYERHLPYQLEGKDEAGRQAAADRLRRRYRIGELEALIEPPAAPDDDAELLALGREFDALHAAWMVKVEGLREAEERVDAFLAASKGKQAVQAHRKAWEQPGCSEAADAKEKADGELEKVMKKIHALPARTVAGLAVKARVAIPAIWTGSYEADAGLGWREDWGPQNARNLIGDCLALGGVDWRGRAAGAALRVEPHGPAYDLSACTLAQLARLCEAIQSCWHHVGAHTQAPCFWDHTGERSQNAAGRILEAEVERLGFFLDAISAEAARRSPADADDRDERLSLLLGHEILCNGMIEDRALLADAVAAWGA